MNCKIEFRALQYYQGQAAYELLYTREYDAGTSHPQIYWDTAGCFPDEFAARKAAIEIKKKNKTITFEV